MKIKHFFIGAGVSLALALGGVGLGLAAAPKDAVKAEASAGDRTSQYQLMGDALGIGWNNGANENYQFIEKTNTFEWSGHFSAGLFRVTKPGTWHDNKIGGSKLDGNAGGAFASKNDSDDNIECKTAGYYTASLNSDKSKISFTSVTPVFSLIGSFSGHNWDYDEHMTVDTTAHTATLNSVELAKGDVFKVRAFDQWAEEYGWSNASEHISVTDAWSRGQDCFGGDNGNIAVLHDGTYNLVLNYSTYELAITGARAEYDTEVNFRIFISSDGGSTYVPTVMDLKSGSTTEYVITRDFVAGEKFYFRFGSYYYHYNNIKDTCTLKGTQFVADGQDTKVLYSANYTIYFETSTEGNNFGGWLQYNSVSSAQVRENVIAYAKYFNTEVGGACDIQGKTTVISNLQTAWSNVKTRFDNAPANDIRTAIKAATASDTDEDVAEFVEKYASVYELRGNSLGTQGGDFLQKGITPKGAGLTVFGFNSNESNNSSMWIIAAVAVASLVAVGGFFFIRKRKENN